MTGASCCGKLEASLIGQLHGCESQWLHEGSRTVTAVCKLVVTKMQRESAHALDFIFPTKICACTDSQPENRCTQPLKIFRMLSPYRTTQPFPRGTTYQLIMICCSLQSIILYTPSNSHDHACRCWLDLCINLGHFMCQDRSVPNWFIMLCLASTSCSKN